MTQVILHITVITNYKLEVTNGAPGAASTRFPALGLAQLSLPRYSRESGSLSQLSATRCGGGFCLRGNGRSEMGSARTYLSNNELVSSLPVNILLKAIAEDFNPKFRAFISVLEIQRFKDSKFNSLFVIPNPSKYTLTGPVQPAPTNQSTTHTAQQVTYIYVRTCTRVHIHFSKTPNTSAPCFL